MIRTTIRTALAVYRAAGQHELTRNQKLGAMARFLRLQMASRLANSKILFEFANGARMFGGAGLTGANGNYYYGLMELRDMAFLLHYLRPNDLFVDVGANAGAYTILASAAAGARSVCFEPVESTVRHLRDNILINDISLRSEIRQICISHESGEARFTTHLDTVNHMTDSTLAPSVIVPVSTIDLEIGEVPALIKIDTEGFDEDVIFGARRILSTDAPLALIVEFNESRGKHSNSAAKELLDESGFTLVEYDPFLRRIVTIESNSTTGNWLYVRGLDHTRARVAAAPKFRIGKFAEI